MIRPNHRVSLGLLLLLLGGLSLHRTAGWETSSRSHVAVYVPSSEADDDLAFARSKPDTKSLEDLIVAADSGMRGMWSDEDIELKDLAGVSAALKHQKYGIRYRAATVLVKLEDRAEPAIPDLIEALGDDGAFLGSNSDFVCLMACRALLSIGLPALPALCEAAAKHSKIRVRRRAIWVLKEMGHEAEAVVPVLEALVLRDESIGPTAANALWKIDPKNPLVVPMLMKGLYHGDADERHAAGVGLAEIRPVPPEAIRALMAHCGDRDRMMRAAAAEALGQMGAEARMAIPILRNAARDDDWYIRETAIGALERLGAKDRETVLIFAGALGDVNDGVRRAAARALCQVGAAGQPAVSALVHALADKEWQVQTRAIEALGHIGPGAGSAVPALLRIIDDPKAKTERPDLRVEAARSLGRIGPNAGDAVPVLINTFREGSRKHEQYSREREQLAAVASEALGRIGPRAIPAVMPVLQDPDPAIRARALDAFGAMAEAARESVLAVTFALKDPDLYVRTRAASALWKVSGQATPVIPVLLDALRSRDSHTHITAGEILFQMGPAAGPAVPTLVDLLRTNEESHWGVVHALRGIGPAAREAVPALTLALRNDNRSIRKETAWTLGKLGADAADAVPALGLALNDEEVDVRYRAAGALGRIGPSSAPALPALRRALQDRDAAVRASAAFAVGQIGPRASPAVPALARALRDPDTIVRWASLTALEGLGPTARDAVPALAEAVQDRRTRLRAETADYTWHTYKCKHHLWNMGAEEYDSVPVLVFFLKDRPATLPERAARTLAGIGPSARHAVPALRLALEDDRIGVRRQAARALQAIDPRTAEHLQPGPRQLQRLWMELSADDPDRAYRALCAMVIAPRKSVSFLKEQLSPVLPANADQVTRLLSDLDADHFVVRERASAELAKLGDSALPYVRRTLAGPLSSLELRRRLERLVEDATALPNPGRLQIKRAVWLLEQIDTPESETLLESLATGVPEATLTRLANAAVKRRLACDQRMPHDGPGATHP